jgi:hypothetical protein
MAADSAIVEAKYYWPPMNADRRSSAAKTLFSVCASTFNLASRATLIVLADVKPCDT